MKGASKRINGPSKFGPWSNGVNKKNVEQPNWGTEGTSQKSKARSQDWFSQHQNRDVRIIQSNAEREFCDYLRTYRDEGVG